MSRVVLPARRPSATIEVLWLNHGAARAFHVTVGFCPATARPLEVFYGDGMKSGADLRHTLDDACVLISLLLQRGATVAEIRKSMGTTDAGRAASIVGAVLAALSNEVNR